MHIIIGFITALAGLIWALNSLQNSGFDLNSLNPFAWMRRRKWKKQLGIQPIHALTDTMDAAALLVVAIAKEQGEITRDTKLEILALFEKEFGVKRGKAIEMYSSSLFMLQGTLKVAPEIRRMLKPSKSDFSPSHVDKLYNMINLVANLEGISDGQAEIIKAIEAEFNVGQEKAKNW